MHLLGQYIPPVILAIVAGIFGLLIVCTAAFFVMHRTKPTVLSSELLVRTTSWWIIATGIVMVAVLPSIFGTVLLAYVSFIALREMLSIGRFRDSDRTAMFVAYFAIPVQYYLAHNNHYEAFLCFIPLVMFVGLPVILVMTGNTTLISKSMTSIPTILMLTVYMISHIPLFFHLDNQFVAAGPGGLILYLVLLTALNDVFQYTWGKLLGQRKILPSVSPNKTWEGFIGGIITTAALAVGLRFLTPLSIGQAAATGLILGIMGFLGDSIMSALKRDFDIKDTDDLIPGHGGVMDRMDSIVITAPVFYHLLTYFTS